jgi:hypothetical protein
MTDRSFVRFGGLAGILLAITSWVAVAEYYTLARGGTDVVGLEGFQFLYALIGFWALIGIVAVRERVRSAGESWSFFATLVGAIAAVGTIGSGVYEAAALRATGQVAAIDPVSPLGLMTFGLTGVWFLITALLMWRTDLPKLLTVLGFVAVADLFVGFIASLAAISQLATLAGVVAGAVGGPLFWLWLGILLRRPTTT